MLGTRPIIDPYGQIFTKHFSLTTATLARRRGLRKLSDLDDLAIREHGADFQIRSDGVEEACQRADVHVGSALQPRHVSLSDLQLLGDLDLGQFLRLRQLMERHLFHQPKVLRSALRARLGRHLRVSSLKFLAIASSLLLDRLEVPFKQAICDRHVDVVPTVITSLIVRCEKNRRAPRIKCVEHP